MNGKGYLIPENIIPEGMRCFCVFIPDDDMYQYAFFGAYEFFGKWIAWERDAAKRGKDAAAAWQAAIEMTRESMGCEPIDYTNVFQNLVDAIGNISINQTVSVDSGGCCGTTIPDDSTLPVETDTTVIDPEGDPPDGFSTWEEYQTAKCRDTDWLISQVIDASRAMNGGYLALVSSLTFGLASALFVAAFPPAVVAVLPALVVTAVVTAILSAVASGQYNKFDEIADQLETDRQDRFCDLIAWDSPTSLRNLLLVSIQTAGLDAGNLPQDIEDLMDIYRLIYDGDYLNHFVSNIGNNAPVEYVQVADCSCVEPPPAIFTFDTTAQGWYTEYESTPPPASMGWSNNGNPAGGLRVDFNAGTAEQRGYLRYDISSQGIIAGASMPVSTHYRMGGSNPGSIRTYIYIWYVEGGSDSYGASGSTTSWTTMSLSPTAGNYGKTISHIELRAIKLSGYATPCYIDFDNVNISAWV